MLQVLQHDFTRIPELMGRGLDIPEPEPVAALASEPAVQLGLF